MSKYLVTWQIDIEDSADNATEAAVQALLIQRDKESSATVFTVTNKETGEVEEVDLDSATCLGCGAIEGTPEYGTVGDGFDGYCPSCADKREETGEVELG